MSDATVGGIFEVSPSSGEPPRDPLARFVAAFERAKEREPFDATAVALATSDAAGRPAVRIVLLKSVDARGFVFFTNRESRKARDLHENPQAAMCFYWPKSEEQIRVEGRIEIVPDHESDAYFESRPRGSQIGAWASDQSRPIASRYALERKVEAFEARYAGKPVPRPPHWGGYRLVPERIEFWYGRQDRLHDRELYERASSEPASDWRWSRLQP